MAGLALSEQFCPCVCADYLYSIMLNYVENLVPIGFDAKEDPN